jgi:cyclopropane fatty-acyl-phospholipid synthase-like methyltransferase
MKSIEHGHTDKGITSILSKSWAYDLKNKLVGYEISRNRLVTEFIQPQSGDRILDIGCGPGVMLKFLPDTYGQYLGIDINQKYIDSASRSWINSDRCRFRCENINESRTEVGQLYDIVLAIGVLHHLRDDELSRMLEFANARLRPGGRLITHDCVYVEEQSRFVRWIIERDRGKAVRTVPGYRDQALRYFPNIDLSVLHNMFRIPYTVLVMVCHKI